MNKSRILSLVLAVFGLSAFLIVSDEPWTSSQLLEPSVLAKAIQENKGLPYTIVSVGPGDEIPGTVHYGPCADASRLEAFKNYLSKRDRNEKIVIYCGCCPFKNCPNVRPAFRLLNELGFKNHLLLNIPDNLKKDWIDKGYPVK